MSNRIFRLLPALCLLFLVISPASAQEYVVEYAEGSLAVRRGGQWMPAFPGDRVASSATVRLEEDAYVELSDGDTVLRLARPGTYRLSDLSRGRAAAAEHTISTMIRHRLEILTGAGERGPSTAAGVRGAEGREPDSPEWLGGESSHELVSMGRAALADGDLEQARALFDDALLLAMPSQEAEAYFYLGYTHYLLGELRRAREYLSMEAPAPGTEHYHEHLIILAQTELELSSPGAALKLLSSYVASPDHDEELLPVVHLLMGLGHRMAGDVDQAREELERARYLAPESEAAATAGALLAEL